MIFKGFLNFWKKRFFQQSPRFFFMLLPATVVLYLIRLKWYRHVKYCRNYYSYICKYSIRAPVPQLSHKHEAKKKLPWRCLELRTSSSPSWSKMNIDALVRSTILGAQQSPRFKFSQIKIFPGQIYFSSWELNFNVLALKNENWKLYHCLAKTSYQKSTASFQRLPTVFST